MIKLKKFSQILTLLCLCLFLFPVKAHASEVKSDFFTVDLSVGEHNCIGPGDTFRETIEIKNTTDYPIKVRIFDVDNINDSKLYPVLMAAWAEDEEESKFVSFDELTPSEWYVVEKGKTLHMPMDVHFPLECGNEYQGTTATARFIVEARIAKEVVGDFDQETDDTNPKTGDSFNLRFWSTVSTVSGLGLLIVLLVASRRKKKDKA